MATKRNLNKSHYYLFLWVMSILLIVAGTVVSEAATYYVAPSGSDTAAGTLAQPFGTIARGLSFLKAGDTLYIRAGTYSERIDSNRQTIPTGTSWADAPIIAGYPGEIVTLRGIFGSGGTNGIINLAANYIQYVEFRNLILDQAYQNASFGGSANHVKFTNITLSNGWHQCMQTGVASSFFWFTGGHVFNCALTDTTTPTGYPFYLAGNDHLIEYSEIHHAWGYCIHIYQSPPGPFPQRNIIRNNRFHDCSISKPSSAAIGLLEGDSHVAYNNVLYANKGHGIMTSTGTTNSKIYNNTVYGGAQTGIYLYPNSSGADVRNNIVYGNATTQILDEGSTTNLFKNLTTDPRFVNAAALDFTLQTGSPAIDAGQTLAEVTTDIQNTPRPQGGAYDIGAYEGGAAGGDTIPPSPPKNVTLR